MFNKYGVGVIVVVFSGLLSILSLLLAFMMVASNGMCAIVENGDFEEIGHDLAGRGWDVYNEIPGWKTVYGAGIEVQKGVVSRAQSGDQFY